MGVMVDVLLDALAQKVVRGPTPGKMHPVWVTRLFGPNAMRWNMRRWH
jgi:hypothetical protein